MKRDLAPILFLLALIGPAVAQDAGKKAVAVDQDAVDKAIENGLGFLKTSDSPKGAGLSDSDELKLLTLIHGGVPQTDPAYQALWTKCMEARLEKTYKVALLALCLEEVDRVKYQYKLAQCGQFLLDNLKPNGGFSYGEPTVHVDDVPTTASRKGLASAGGKVKSFEATEAPREKPAVKNKIKLTKKKDGPAQRSDNSNSQYAALGIRACHDAGIVFPKAEIEKARKYWEANQHAGEKGDPKGRPAVASGGYEIGVPRGWCYSDDQASGCGHGGPAYSSMSAGAIGAVCIYDFILGKDWKKDKVALDGMAWLDKNWTVTENIGPAETAKGSNGWLYYYLYALERTGMLFDTPFVGSHDWYLDGARMLLNAQRPDGSWNGSHFRHPTWDTCFAILFLKRATHKLVASTDRFKKP
jgi:hypothetical protein